MDEDLRETLGITELHYANYDVRWFVNELVRNLTEVDDTASIIHEFDEFIKGDHFPELNEIIQKAIAVELMNKNKEYYRLKHEGKEIEEIIKMLKDRIELGWDG